MEPLYLDRQDPSIYEHMVSLAKAVSEVAETAGLDPLLVELVNLRISQINGCAFCLDVHTRRAVKYGESQQRLGVLATWREAGIYSEMERAALEVAELVTLLPEPEQRLAAEYRVREVLSDAEFSAVAWIAVAMNAFNRVSIISRHPVRPPA